MDVKPPKNWRQTSPGERPALKAAPRQPTMTKPDTTAPQPVTDDSPVPTVPTVPDVPAPPPTSSKKTTRKMSLSLKLAIIFATIAVVIMTGLIAVYSWAITPYSADPTKQLFLVVNGETPTIIGQHLEEQKLIRSSIAFDLYARLNNKSASLKVGSYKIAPNQSVEQIVNHLVKGDQSYSNVMIPPGVTLKQLADPSFKGGFAAQGYSQAEIQEAFKARYSNELLKDRPAGATLEGYIFPEPFQVRDGDSLGSVLERSFDELYSRLQRDGMLKKFAEKGLNIHQAMTLASIVQEEASDAGIQPQIAAVFYNRLKLGMALGSDVTFIYAAQQDGVAPRSDYASPYNTRIYTGLPPGPIATSNFSAIQAVANPAVSDYLFFVAGDDGKIYFSRTNEEHEQLVRQHCRVLCALP